MHFRDHRFCQITPAPSDLQVNLLLARKPAMSIGFTKTAPASDRRKIDAGGVLGARAKIVPGREMRTAAGDSLFGLSTTPPESASGACGFATSGRGCPEACLARFVASFPISALDFIYWMVGRLTLPVRLGLARGRVGEPSRPAKIRRPVSSAWQIARHARSMRSYRLNFQAAAN